MRISVTVVIILLSTFLPTCSHQQVSYKNDVDPILDSNCNGCHAAPYGYGYRLTGLKMDTYDDLMQGTIYGPVIISGDSRRSILNKLVEGRTGNMQILLHNDDEESITKQEVEILKNWVDQGAINN